MQLLASVVASNRTCDTPLDLAQKHLRIRLKLDRVADDTTRAIDRFFDAVDNGVDNVARVLNRTQRTEEQIRAETKRRVVIDTQAHEKRKAPAASASTAVTTRPRFRIVESIDPKSGKTIFVVTDGSARTECATREFAAQILKALEKTP